VGRYGKHVSPALVSALPALDGLYCSQDRPLAGVQVCVVGALQSVVALSFCRVKDLIPRPEGGWTCHSASTRTSFMERDQSVVEGFRDAAPKGGVAMGRDAASAATRIH